MDNRGLAGLIRRAGFGDVEIECAEHAGRRAACFCSSCRVPFCRDCAALRFREIRCGACPPPRRRSPLMTPMGASAACIGALTLAALLFGGRFRTVDTYTRYNPVPEPPAVVEAMDVLFHAKRLRDGADAIGDPARAEKWRRLSNEAYARFETLYPADDDRVPAAMAIAAARYARGVEPARDQPAGLLWRIDAMEQRADEAELLQIKGLLAQSGGFIDQVAKAYASQQASNRRSAIERATGAVFSVAVQRQRVEYLLGRVYEATGRREEALAAYKAAGDYEPARERLGALRPAETITVERIGD